MKIKLFASTGFLPFLASILLLGFVPAGRSQPFVLQGVNTNHFRVTTYATGLNFPLGMARLPDDSLLVTVTDGNSFYTSNGRIVRLTDTNQNGVANGPAAIVYTGIQGAPTALRLAGNLVLVTGQARPINILRLGATPASTLTLVGRITITYPSGWLHTHSALGVRPTPGTTNSFEVISQVGADGNEVNSTRVATMTNTNVPGATGTLVGDSIHQFTLIDNGGTNIIATNFIQIASGLRNPAGYAFHPATGDLYFQDNGIDGLADGNEPLSADELNYIARTNLGGAAEYFGFATNYTRYRTNNFVGGAGIPPLIAFQPLPNPLNGRESEGANDVTFAPPGFPDGVNSGVFIGFHGKFSSGGAANEENPLVYADPVSKQYFHFILGQQVGIGHLDGLLATRDSLFVADLVTTGNPGSGSGAGAIYQIKSLVTPTAPHLAARAVNGQVQLSWDRGTLEAAASLAGPWNDVADGYSPLVVVPGGPGRFYRTKY